jgi:predicted nucleic acid-binding protein
VLICDTSALVALFDSDDAHHAGVAAQIEADDGPFVVSPFVVAELDYLLATRRGVREELAALEELAGGAWELAGFDAHDLRSAAGVVSRYADQAIGIADASMVILADRYGTDRLLTLDRRHFHVVRTLAGAGFTVLPSQGS